MSMDTKTFFTILVALLVITVFANMLDPTTTLPVFNASVNTSALQASNETCESIVPFWCGITEFGSAIVNAVTAFFSFLWQGLLFLVALFVFFTGAAAIINGTLLPEPFGWMGAIILIFAWLFLALDAVSRIIGVFWGR